MPLEEAAKRATARYQDLAANSPAPPGSTEEYRNVDDLAYALSQISMFTPRPLKMAVMGAGFSGMSIAHAVSTGRLKNIDLTIYEKNANLGGTWWENRYPGCACKDAHCASKLLAVCLTWNFRRHPGAQLSSTSRLALSHYDPKQKISSDNRFCDVVLLGPKSTLESILRRSR